MKNKKNPLKIDKRIQRGILIFVILILVCSILILIFSLFSDRSSSSVFKSHGKSQFSGKSRRHFSVESESEHIYNLGQYEVNLNTNKLLILNLSIQCYKECFEPLQEHNILIQNAVIETFASYGSMKMANTSRGKEKIKRHLLKNINKSLYKPLIREVYFNTFIIQ